MKLTSTILVLALGVFVSLSASAGEEKLSERKAHLTAHLDNKIAKLNEFKSCVSGASKGADIKACRATHKESMKAIKESRKGKMNEWKAKHKKHK